MHASAFLCHARQRHSTDLWLRRKIWGREGGYISTDIGQGREFGGLIGAREGKRVPFRVLTDDKIMCWSVRNCELYGTLRL
jgi:hypothetical protein